VHALEGNLCRCTGYNNIVAAVRQAADELARGGADGLPASGSGSGSGPGSGSATAAATASTPAAGSVAKEA